MSEMWRAAKNRGGGAGVVVDGEVRVERVEKIDVAMNGIQSPTTTPATLPGKAAERSPLATAVSGKAAVPDVNELAEEFIRRNRAAFQFQGIGDRGQN
ncbi:unnamed protein product [Urochloa decumbens]|uniref:Uncharacterized protein n=1 Tax=Urochloa decumbens TaxID=240449 RepID=A0ABC8WJ27_9POAL